MNPSGERATNNSRALVALALLLLSASHIRSVASGPFGVFGLPQAPRPRDDHDFETYVAHQMLSLSGGLTLCRVGPVELDETVDLLAERLRDSVLEGRDQALLRSLVKAIGMDDEIQLDGQQAAAVAERQAAPPAARRRNVQSVAPARSAAPVPVPDAAADAPKPNLAKQTTKSRYQFGETAGGLGNLLTDDSQPLGEHIVLPPRQFNMARLIYNHFEHMQHDDQRELLKKIEDLYGPEDEQFRREAAAKSCRTRSDSRRRKRDLGAALACASRHLTLGPKALANLLKRVFLVGVEVMDQVYMAPEFVDKIPVIGDIIVELRERGRPLYKIIEFIRSSHYLYKVQTKPRSSNDLDSADSEPDDIHEQIRASRAKRLIGEIGMDALKVLADTLIDRLAGRSLDEEGRREFIKRSSMALVSFVIPHQSTQKTLCRIG